MRWPHLIVISAAGSGPSDDDPDFEPGEQSPEDGIYDQWPDRMLYHGRADCQDVGESIIYGQDVTNVDSDATIFLKDESVIYSLQSGMRVHVIFDPRTGEEIRDAVVDRVTILDGSLKVKWL